MDSKVEEKTENRVEFTGEDAVNSTQARLDETRFFRTT